MSSVVKSILGDYVTSQINQIASNKDNTIFVSLGIEQYVDLRNIKSHIADIDTFFRNGSKKQFGQQWFVNLFGKLTATADPRDFTILSYPQFSNLISYVSPDFFKDRVVILRDGLRNLLPISKEEYIERAADENIELRSADMPDYMAEQMQIGDSYFYSVKMPVENFEIIDIFTERAALIPVHSSTDLEVIDIVSDPHAVDTFVNKCLAQNSFRFEVAAKFFKKQPLEEKAKVLLERLNWMVNQFGGQICEFDDVAIQAEHQSSETATNLLHQYWGEKADFRPMKVYSNPSYDKSIKTISQGLIVDTIIDEYNKAKQGIVPKDLFLTAPTGSGKSLLFQLPAFHVSSQGDVTIVVSPLIALMKDQVEQIRRERNYKKVYYINSELSLIDRERVIDDCKSGEIDVLYLSPELLLSYDISYFIGDRRLGLVVIDEAHLITTWGRDFRVDYWFLGQHINKIRKIKDYHFPMVAVTATAIYGGDNDMVFDSINSLYMHDPHIFIGEIKREDITFVIDNHEKYKSNYDREKINETVAFIERIAELGIKTIVYAPYRRHIDLIQQQLQLNGKDGIAVSYHSGLSADEKNYAYDTFKRNEAKVMISTKAFGMGVDIPDIQLVYHHAPSGLLPDYVQEIGRAARKTDIKGFAALSYALEDQRYSKVLHGISALHHYQIREVIRKINKLFIANDQKRNMLVSADDFSYIFDETADYDQKVMTALMMIEKDYLAKFRFNVLIARPKKLFVKVYSRVNSYGLSLLKQRYPQCFKNLTKISGDYHVVELDLDKIWEKSFSDISFPMLKKQFYDGQLLQDQGVECKPQVKLTFTFDIDIDAAYQRVAFILDKLQSCFARLAGHYFTKEDLDAAIAPFVDDKKQREKLIKFILSTYTNRPMGGGVENDAFLQRRRKVNQDVQYAIFGSRYNNNFENLKRRLLKLKDGLFNNTATKFASYGTEYLLNYIRIGSILEILGLGTYESRGGDNPMIFIRINDPRRIAKDASDNSYRNSLLRTIENRHKISSEIFDHFFLKAFSNKDRWNFIEDFFLGEANDVLFSTYPGGERNHIDIVNYVSERASSRAGATNQESQGDDSISTFTPRQGATYYNDSMLTIDGVTKKVSKWLKDDPVSLDKTIRAYDIRIQFDTYKVLQSRLENHHFEYFRDVKGLKLYIDFPGYDGRVIASVPYSLEPIKFYNWWRKNENKVTMTNMELLRLLIRVNDQKPNALLKKHRDILKAKGYQ